jgi:hypothetical protein
MESGEKYLGNILYSVTLDGKHFANGVTSALDGSYEIKATEEGRYCVKVKSLEMQTPLVPISAILAPVPSADTEVIDDNGVTLKAAKAASICGKTGVNDDYDCDGKLNKDDNDDDGDSVIDKDDNCPFKSNSNQTDADNSCDDEKFDGTQKCGDACEDDDDDDDDKSSAEAPTYSPGESCIGLESFSGATLNVPITRSYSISALLTTSSTDVQAGDTFFLKFYYPESCNIFHPMILPPEIQRGLKWKAGAEENEAVNLSTDEFFPGQSISSYSISEDKVTSKMIDLVTDPNLIADTETGFRAVTVETIALCPDGKTKVPIKHTVNIYEKFPIDVSPTLAVADIADLVVDEEILVIYSISNKSKSAYDDVELTLSSTHLTVKEAKVDGFSGACDPLGHSVVCNFSLDIAPDLKSLTVKFFGPDAAGTYNVDASIKINSVPPVERVLDKKKVSFTVKEP